MHIPESPVLFLDIDGVMNTTDSALLHRGGHVFTQAAVDALRWIAQDSDCVIVISSTRRCEGIDAVRRLFEHNALDEVATRIIGLTPVIGNHDSDEWREDEIEAWLDDHGQSERLGILDDKPFTGPLRRFLVQTDSDYGLTMALARRILWASRCVLPD